MVFSNRIFFYTRGPTGMGGSGSDRQTIVKCHSETSSFSTLSGTWYLDNFGEEDVSEGHFTEYLARNLHTVLETILV